MTDSRFHEPFTRGGTEGGIQNGYLQSRLVSFAPFLTRLLSFFICILEYSSTNDIMYCTSSKIVL